MSSGICRMGWRHLLSGLVLLIGLALWLGMWAPAARAEESPITVPLSYVVNLSNWGPTTATGTAQVWRTEAEVRLNVAGLPVLTGQRYACWLVNTQAGAFLAVGRFNVGNNGAATLDVSMPGSVPDGYSTVLITVQPDPETKKGTPSKLYSIAGFFPGNAAIQHQVQHLPDTGQYAEHPPFESTIQPDNPTSTTAVKPVGSGANLLPYVPLALGIASIIFVMRRQKRRDTKSTNDSRMTRS
jgi:hypothetical protein